MGFTDVKYRNSVRDKDDEDRGRLVQNIEYEMVLRRALRKTKDSHQRVIPTGEKAGDGTAGKGMEQETRLPPKEPSK